MALRFGSTPIGVVNGIPWLAIAAGGVGLLSVTLVVALRGRKLLAGFRRSLVSLGLSSELMARSLAFGFVFGVMPVYIPAAPSIVVPLLAKLLGLSMPAALLGMSSSTPAWLTFLVPYIRAGELIGGMDALAVNDLVVAMRKDSFGACRNFAGRLLLAMLAWLLTAPLLLAASYFAFRPLCQAIEGRQVCCLPRSTIPASGDEEQRARPGDREAEHVDRRSEEEPEVLEEKRALAASPDKGDDDNQEKKRKKGMEETKAEETRERQEGAEGRAEEQMEERVREEAHKGRMRHVAEEDSLHEQEDARMLKTL